ncbi:MAG: CRISPR/Cas system-associated exonuclease Cas4 (RecB family) [Candidatus Paceibacteria bacterium]|jgi:CRISPR/Cas system-associated exonuclease Cas4 (RecB family)
MPQFYNPRRSSNWNYGGSNWRLSRSKIDLFVECPRCFYMDNKLGTKRPGGFPFNLNSAVDTLLKKEFDIHRNAKTVHPLVKENGINAIPFQHGSMDVWRDNFKGVEFFHKDTGFTVCGAVDDIWINEKGELHVVDYKATSKDEKVNIDAEWQNSYKRQMEVYQWLLRKNDFEVSDTGYFVYVNGRTDLPSFDGKLEFESTLIPYEGSADWIEDTLFRIKETLDSDEIPKLGEECEYCSHYYVRNEHEK